MYTVQMVFDVEWPDLEDQPIRDYLAEYKLEPGYQWYAENDGRRCQWLQFGGRYLSKHLQGIGQLQRKAVEVEVLTEEIARYLESVSSGVEFSSEDQRQLVVTALVGEFQPESTFQVSQNGELAAVLDQVEVAAYLRRLLSDELERAMGVRIFSPLVRDVSTSRRIMRIAWIGRFWTNKGWSTRVK